MFQKIHLVFTVIASDTKMSKNCVLLALVACAFSALALVEAEIASKEFLNKQKIAWELFQRVDQPELMAEHYTVGKDWSLEANSNLFKNQEYVTNFLKIYKKGMLPRGETFSIFYPLLREEAIALFRVFYQAKDFDTLYKTAAWARIHVNEEMFIYVWSVVILHHPETRYIRIPAPHELFPHLYFNTEVIRRAYDAKTSINPKKSTQFNEIIIPANYSQFYPKYNYRDANIITYYTEDVPVNEVQYYAHLAHPFWMSAKEFPEILKSRGDRYLWQYKLQLIRYNMERHSNNLADVEDFDWNYPIPFSYYPTTSYRNGLPLPHRETKAPFPSYNYKWIQELKTWEFSILQGVNMGTIITPDGNLTSIHSEEGLQYLGNMLEGNVNSINPKAYGQFDIVARSVLGFSPEPYNRHKVFPSTLEYYGLDQRDPAYWGLVKKTVNIYDAFMDKLPSYTLDDLGFSGVKINSVVVDRVTTFFSPKDYLISNAVKAYGPEDKTVIKARQFRLDHKPYSQTITVTSDKETKADIYLYLGYKYEGKNEKTDICKNWKNYMALDQWVVDLKVGTNTFVRSSLPTLNAAPDQVSGDVFYQKILNAIAGTETFEKPNQLYGFPERMVIPKGQEDGLLLSLFVMIRPHFDNKVFHSKSPILGDRYFSNTALGFPFDRHPPLFFEDLPNVHFADFVVYHRDEFELNLTV